MLLMDKQALKKKIHQKLFEKLNDHGFNKKVSDNEIKRAFKEGFHIIHLPYLNKTDGFDVVLNVAIRFEKLEDLKHQYREDIGKKRKKQTASLGVEYGNLTGIGQHHWKIRQEEDVDAAVESIFLAIKETMLPYLEEYSNLEFVLEKMMKEEQKEVLKFSPIDYVRAINALGLAVLLNKDETFINTLIENKTNYLKGRDDFQLQKFLEFVEQLKK